MIASGPTIRLPNPHPAQAEVLRGRKRFNVVACGRRWGKTRMGGTLAIEAALAGVPVGWFAPTYKFLGDAMEEIVSRTSTAGDHVKFNKGERRITFPNGGSIEFWSTEPAQAGAEESDIARGRKYARIVYDEAAHARRLKADWNRAIRATLTDYRGDAWFFSTPRGQDYFHHLFLKGQSGDEGWASFQMPTSRNPHIDASEIESARRDVPKDAFEQEYLAQFLANAANPFGIEAIRACLMEGLASGPVVAWGVDLAKSHDWTVAIGLNARGEVRAYQRWQSDWRNTRARLAAMLRHAPSLVDSTGVGDPIVEDLQTACGLCEGYQFTSQSKQRLMEGLALAIQNQRVRFESGMIQTELETFRYEYRPGGVRYSAPDGLHDDCVCALALAVECQRTNTLSFSFDAGSPRDAMASAFDPWGDGDDD